jgi:serine/threonine-protein kinase
MPDHVTLLRPEAPAPEDRGLSASLPHDLLEQVRGRLRVLALLVIIGFAIDPLLFFGSMLVARLSDSAVPPEYARQTGFYLADIAVVAGSALLWWVARSPRVSSARLLTIGLAYEVVICFVIALRTYWEFHRVMGALPNLTWVPAVVILFPLILPAPPRVMLAVSIAAGAMQPIALLLLDALGKVPAGVSDLVNASINSMIAVGFAWMGSRVVYGLGRQVAAAREMGAYRLQEMIGQGGMGEVWRAEHRMLARPAAIKLIRHARMQNGAAGVSSDAIRRFEREARVISRLRSPHTVELFDFGVADDGSFYYVMELLDGLDAHALVRRHGPVPPERAVFLLRQVCHSLSEAESCRLVHRDIKPANIFLCRYGEDCDFVKVLDFGIAKGAREEAAGGPELTRENAVQGTPAFIAPEQALGTGPVDGRADVYAAGCVAYWLLTGQLVFTAETPIGLMAQHASASPIPPSARTDRPIPPALDALILSCLAKDPAARPQSARELSRRLGEAVAPETWTGDHASAWWHEHMPAPERGPLGRPAVLTVPTVLTVLTVLRHV